MELAPGTLLQAGKYKITEKLGQGGFGIAYRAHHLSLKRDVCIKEFFYSDLCERAQNSIDVTIITKSSEKLNMVNSFKKKFTKEAQRLAKFQHPNIVQVLDTFEENNTAYFVMEYLDGGSLEELINRNGALSEEKAKQFILPIIDALDTVHEKKLLHLDLKPANIILRKNQSPVLIDFGISKYLENRSDTEYTKTTAPVGISKGYAPLEQYGGSISDFSKATDVYSLCATIYKVVTGLTPPEPLQMISNGFKPPKEIRPGISISLNTAIVKGLATSKGDRHQSMSELKVALGESEKTSTTIVEVEEPALTTATAYLKRAKEKRNSKLYKEAILDYTEAIKLDSTKYIYYERALCYEELKEYNAAIKDYTFAINKDSKFDIYYMRRAFCKSELGETDAAIEDYSKVIDLSPNNSDAYLYRGYRYLDKGYYFKELAVSDFFIALEIEKGIRHFSSWFNVIKDSDSLLSLETLDKYLSHDWPNKDRVYFERGKIQIKNKERTKAIVDLNQAKQLGNTEAAELLKQINWSFTRDILPFIVLFFSNSLILVALYLLPKNFIFEEDDYFHSFLAVFLLILCVTSFFLSLTKPGRFNDTVLTFSVPRFTPEWFQRLEKINYSVFPLISFVIFYYIYEWGEYKFGTLINHGQNDLIWILVLLSIISIFSLGYIWKRR